MEWSKLGSQAEFDRVVEAFFVKAYAHESGETYAVNGRGGDGGVDIQIRHGGNLVIAQLKYFPEGFSGGFKDTRQKQILESFTTALQHDCDEWWLVVPTTLTPGERKYALGLPDRQKPPLTNPKVRIFDAPELDNLASEHPDLATYFTRDELLEAAKVYNQETAMLIDQGDVVARVAALAKQADTLDPDWRLDLFTHGDIVGTTVVAKHPLAAERSPITIRMNATFSADQAELQRRFERVLGYGTPERIDLPASVVSNYIVDGPAFLTRASDNVEVSWLPVESEADGLPFGVVFYGENDDQTATFSGKTVWTGSATVGASVKAEFYNTVTLEFLLPHAEDGGVSMSVGVDLAGREPSDIVRAVSMLERFDVEHDVTLEIDGQQLARLLMGENGHSVLGENRDGILAHKGVAADLVYVQDQTAKYFTYPETVTPADRVYLRCLRRLLEGCCIVLPEQNQVSVTLNGKDSENSRRLLAGVPMQLLIDQENFGIEVFGRNFHLGHSRIHAPKITAVGAGGLIKNLDAGDVGGRQVTLRTEPAYGFWVFILRKVIADADGQARPKSLDLPDYPDAPDVARALAEAG